MNQRAKKVRPAHSVDQPLLRVSPRDLDTLLSTLDVRFVALSECLVSAGFRLEIGGIDAPGIHYNITGMGRIFISDDPPIDLWPHALADALFPDGHEWSEPLRTIVRTAFPANVDFSAGELLDEVRTGVTQMETPTDVDFVRVMSLHKSKGLTAKLVVVMGCIEGMIPRIDFTAPQAERQRSLEEQRRLFYVALTRTTETLILSSVTNIPVQQAYQMGLGVAGGQVQTSRFVTELGPTRPNPIAGNALA